MLAGSRRNGTRWGERGSALLGAMFVVLTISVLSVAYLQLSLSKNREGKSSLDSKRAFYMAESGFAEAFAAIQMGRSGEIASPEEPARFANGVFWVEAEPLAEDKILLQSTGLAGGSRSSLSLVVDRTAVSLPAQGAFGLEQVVLREGAVVDAYDSRLGDYAAQGWDPVRYAELVATGQVSAGAQAHEAKEEPGKGKKGKEDDGSGQSVGAGSQLVQGGGGLGGLLGGVVDTTTNTVGGVVSTTTGTVGGVVDATSGAVGGLVEAAGELVGGVLSGELVTTYTLPELLELGEAFDDPSVLPIGARVGSNGDVLLFGPAASETRPTCVFGDVAPGPKGSAIATSRVLISGGTTPALEEIPLPHHQVPTFEDEGDRTVLAGASYELRDEQSAYGTLRALAGGTLRLRGPLEIVVDELVIEPGATLRVDASDGPIRVWVREYLGLEEDASLEFDSQSPGDFALIVSGDEWIDRDGDGTPDSPAVVRADGSFHGMLSAPAADLELDAELDLFGSVTARRLTLLEGARFHFDQALLDAVVPELTAPRVRAWRFVPLPDEPIVNSPVDPLVQLALAGVTPHHPEKARKDTWLDLQYTCSKGHTHHFRGLKKHFKHSKDVAAILFTSETTPPDGSLPETDDDFLTSLFAHFDLSGFFKQH